jgi:hypothetical protein
MHIYPVQAVKACGGIGGIPALILNFRSRQSWWSASRIDLSTPGYRTSVPIELNVRWAPEPKWPWEKTVFLLPAFES